MQWNAVSQAAKKGYSHLKTENQKVVSICVLLVFRTIERTCPALTEYLRCACASIPVSESRGQCNVIPRVIYFYVPYCE